MVYFAKPANHHAMHDAGAIWLRTLDAFRPISTDEARLLTARYRALAIQHERSDPVFSEYCAAVFQDLHDALTELRNASRVGDERRAAA